MDGSECASVVADDPFDSLNNSTINAYNKGYEEGLREGTKAALIQGAQTGINISLAMTSEIGYYYGICETYSKLNKEKTNQTNAEQKACLIANQLCEHINKMNIDDAQYANLFNDLNIVKDKFKQFCSLTSFKSELIAKAKVNKPELNF